MLSSARRSLSPRHGVYLSGGANTVNTTSLESREMTKKKKRTKDDFSTIGEIATCVRTRLAIFILAEVARPVIIITLVLAYIYAECAFVLILVCCLRTRVLPLSISYLPPARPVQHTGKTEKQASRKGPNASCTRLRMVVTRCNF